MKFFFVMQNLYPIWGGAEKSADTLIKTLQNQGHTVDWMCQSNESEVTPKLSGIMKNVDVIITQLNWTSKAVNLAQKYNKKCVVFIRSYENLCRVVYTDPQEHALCCGQTPNGCEYKVTPYEMQGLALRKADMVIANSKWMQHFLKDTHGIESEVVYPFINFDDYKIENKSRKYISMNQMSYAKGADVFLQIAKKLPTERFKLVGNRGWMPPVDIPRNVEIQKFQDPQDMYGDTWLWLNPARWQEPFGRTVIEAQLAQVPVITRNYNTIIYDKKLHKTGGLIVKDLENINDWIVKIKKIKRKPENYTNKNAHTNLKRFESSVNRDDFVKLMETLK